MLAHERLLKYVQVSTPSDDKSTTNPTTSCQFDLAKVLVEEMNEQDSSLVTGRLDNSSVVHFPGTPDMIGNIYQVKLEECKGFYYIGKVVDHE